MYGTEKMRVEILKAYIGGADYDSNHDRHVIRELKNVGYLRCGVDTDTDAETLKTTEFGEMYLRNNGYKVKRSFFSKIFKNNRYC